MKNKIIVFFVLCLHFVSTLNILGVFPHMGRSHFNVYRVYLQELARRGHNVTVISYFPETNPMKNYHDIILPASSGKGMPVYEQFRVVSFIQSCLSVLYRGIKLMNIGLNSCKVLLANKEVQKLIVERHKFDLVVVEQFNSDCTLGVAYKLRAPVIGINSHTLMPWHYRRYGIPRNPSFTPYVYCHGGTKSSLLQKIEVTIIGLYFEVLYYLYEQRGDQNSLAQYWNDVPQLESLARDVKLMLVYHNFILTGSRLFPPNVIEVGGYHVAEAKPLPEDLQHFIGDADDGVIYISFGTGINSKSLNSKQIEVILEVIEILPQKFIWKWENIDVTHSNTKIYHSIWLPQVDILGHPKTLAFFSHAGMAGMTEAIHFGVPMVAMPFFADQPSNSAAIEECGLGVRIYLENLTKENLLSAFQLVLRPGFRENVKLLSAAWHDRPLPPLQSAVYWTEFAARHRNLTLRTPGADLALYQYYNLDVIFVYVLIIFSITFVIKFTKRVARRIWIPKTKSKIKKS